MAEEAELDLDEELEELELRLERLRALYEQYFLGIEKLEPAVPRKDVERRIWVLRRVKFRNTAKRFKFNVLTQRYNTFQQYWARICREIENGTYKRHMLRAEKAFGADALTIAAKKRRGDFRKAAEEEAPPIEPAIEEPVDSLDAMLGLRKGPAPATVAPEGPAQKSAPRNRFQLERLDLDIDDLLGGGAAPISKRGAGPIGQRPRTEAPPASAPPISGPPISRPAGKAPPTAGPMVAKPRMPKGMAPPEPSSPSAAPSPPPPAVSRSAPTVPPTGSGKPKPPPLPTRSKPPLPARSKPPARTEAPEPAKPEATRAPVRAAPAAAAPARSPATGSGLSDDRLKEIHTRLVDAKKQTNDGKSVTFDGLKRQLQAAEDNLRKQHGNRKIDFDVVIKDGRAVVKPIVK